MQENQFSIISNTLLLRTTLISKDELDEKGFEVLH
jgi:hypothetical protein